MIQISTPEIDGITHKDYNSCAVVSPMLRLVGLLAIAALTAGISSPALCGPVRPPTTAPSAAGPVMRMERDGRRGSRVGQVIRSELATVIRNGNVHGKQGIPLGLNTLISIVDVDMSPDLRNARVKVSIIGERKEKISAIRWLQGNVRGLRHELAKSNRGMKSVPMLSFQHVDVGAATDMMVKLKVLREEREAAAAARGESVEDEEGGLDFGVGDDDAWGEEGGDEAEGDEAEGDDEVW